MKNISKIFSLIIAFVALAPMISFAAEVRLETQKDKVHVGEQFLLNVVVQSEVPLNAIDGKIVFDNNQLQVEDISDGNSVINFWVERPKAKDNTIIFSGATPVGFSGNNQKILSVKFVAKKEGDTPINIAESTAYLNDGSGTKATLVLIPTHITVESGISSNTEISNDIQAPEDFTPFLVKDELLNDNKYSLIFSTQDKDSGISKYEVKEGKFSLYKDAASPYSLEDQNLNHDIFIRVSDNNSNKRVVVFPAKNYIPLWKQIDVIKYIFGIIVIIGSLLFTWKRFLKQ